MGDNQSDLRERILGEIRRQAKELGRPPGIKVFVRQSSYKNYDILRFWQSFGDALSEAGFAPQALQAALSEDSLLETLGLAVRYFGKFPSAQQLRHFLLSNKGSPSHTTFSRFGNRAKMFERLKQFTMGRESFKDVLNILCSAAPPATSTRPSAATTFKEDTPTAHIISDSYIPPVISILPALAVGDVGTVSALRSHGKNEDTEFERRVGVAFSLLGLEVKTLGQGTGRKADGIARSVRGHWALIYDAKVRRGGFRLETEDRKFREYIERHGSELRSEGIERFYFAVVSSSFRESDLNSARAVVRATNAKAFVFIEASTLVHWVEQHLKHVAGYTTNELEARLDTTGVAI